MSPASLGPLPGSNNPSLLGQEVRNISATGRKKFGPLILFEFLAMSHFCPALADDETVACATMRRQRVFERFWRADAPQ